MSDMSRITALVTGASSGIGAATTRLFAQRGARVIAAARRFERLEKLAAELKANCYPLNLDVRDRRAVETAIENLPEGWREIDVLVNNAGLSRGLDRLQEGNPDGWEEMIDTNVKGLLYLSRGVIPGMIQRGRGHVINIGSIAGHEVYPGGNVYCATKHAVDALTKGLLLDLVDTPLRVSAIDPGLVETQFSAVRFYGDRERARTVYQGYRPLAPEDIAEAVIWVASRPAHVQVAQMVVLPTAQASAMVTHKEL